MCNSHVITVIVEIILAVPLFFLMKSAFGHAEKHVYGDRKPGGIVRASDFWGER